MMKNFFLFKIDNKFNLFAKQQLTVLISNSGSNNSV